MSHYGNGLRKSEVIFCYYKVMKSILFLTLFILFTFKVNASKIYTSDITNFWEAYDSIQTTNLHNQKIKFISDLYIKKASDGLKDFIEAMDYSAEEWVKIIDDCPKYWKSVRPQTLSIVRLANDLETISKNFKSIYPEFNDPEIYFTIGCLRSGGTTTKGKILIGLDIGAADCSTDASELNSWLKKMFKVNSGIIQLVAHEMNHTQQIESPDTLFIPSLLSQTILEGSCDFIAELILKKQYVAPHTNYGLAHTKTLLSKFYKNKDQISFDRWLYNGNRSKLKPADLGYYIGYEICKTYYESSEDKSIAIKEIIQLDWNDKNKLMSMLDLTIKKYEL